MYLYPSSYLFLPSLSVMMFYIIHRYGSSWSLSFHFIFLIHHTRKNKKMADPFGRFIFPPFSSSSWLGSFDDILFLFDSIKKSPRRHLARARSTAVVAARCVMDDRVDGKWKRDGLKARSVSFDGFSSLCRIERSPRDPCYKHVSSFKKTFSLWLLCRHRPCFWGFYFFMTRDLSVDRRLGGIPLSVVQTQDDKSSLLLGPRRNGQKTRIEEKQKRLVQDHCADCPSLTRSLHIFPHSLISVCLVL